VFIIRKVQNKIYAQVYTVKTTGNNINSHAQDTTTFKPKVYLAGIHRLLDVNI